LLASFNASEGLVAVNIILNGGSKAEWVSPSSFSVCIVW
jgi:hypothetical protein